MSNLVEFLSKLGSDPALAEAFSKDPETVMTKANLSDDEKALIRTGDLEAIKASTGVTNIKMTNVVIHSYKE